MFILEGVTLEGEMISIKRRRYEYKSVSRSAEILANIYDISGAYSYYLV
mgnify:CR=1 FL=1